ncbi:MAG: hypothetical protein ACI9AR_000184 [Flavobacteriaceae bacterium]|jgi:hypothetical protein
MKNSKFLIVILSMLFVITTTSSNLYAQNKHISITFNLDSTELKYAPPELSITGIGQKLTYGAPENNGTYSEFVKSTGTTIQNLSEYIDKLSLLKDKHYIEVRVNNEVITGFVFEDYFQFSSIKKGKPSITVKSNTKFTTIGGDSGKGIPFKKAHPNINFLEGQHIDIYINGLFEKSLHIYLL